MKLRDVYLNDAIFNEKVNAKKIGLLWANAGFTVSGNTNEHSFTANDFQKYEKLKYKV